MSEQEENQKLGRYGQIMERIFLRQYKEGAQVVPFQREDLVATAHELGIPVPKNLGDILYSFRYRRELPQSILTTAPEGKEWVIPSPGRSQYQFELRDELDLTPRKGWTKTLVLDATPGIVAMYAKREDGKREDEQALLAKIRYNRLIDVFTGITCYSLQNHLRTTVPNIGQVETDEVYVGVDKRGAHYVFPIQAKGGVDKLGRIQLEQDFAVCAHRFPGLIARPIAAKFMDDGTIVLFAFDQRDEEIGILAERHYKLVPNGQLTGRELSSYAKENPLEGLVYWPTPVLTVCGLRGAQWYGILNACMLALAVYVHSGVAKW